MDSEPDAERGKVMWRNSGRSGEGREHLLPARTACLGLRLPASTSVRSSTSVFQPPSLWYSATASTGNVQCRLQTELKYFLSVNCLFNKILVSRIYIYVLKNSPNSTVKKNKN